MTGQTTTRDIAACISVAICLFGASLVPFFLLVGAEHLVPRPVRQAPAAARAAADRAALSAAALLLILTAPAGGTR